jgi:hypothetical protein
VGQLQKLIEPRAMPTVGATPGQNTLLPELRLYIPELRLYIDVCIDSFNE